MKALKYSLMAALAVFLTTSAQAYYQIKFYTLNNDTTPTNPIFDTDSTTKLLGSAGYVGQLYVQVGAGSFTAIGSAVSFLNGGAAGFITGGATPDIIVQDTSVQTTTSGAYQVRVWNTANGSTYEAAAATVGAKVGASSTVSVNLLGYDHLTASAPPGYPTANGFASFSLSTVAVPEPATIALGLFGAAGLLIRRRK